MASSQQRVKEPIATQSIATTELVNEEKEERSMGVEVGNDSHADGMTDQREIDRDRVISMLHLVFFS